MKKLSFIAAILALSISFTSCSDGNSPRSVADNYLDFWIADKYDDLGNLLYFTEEAEKYRADYVDFMEGMSGESDKIISYEFVSEEIDEDKTKAKVYYLVTSVDTEGVENVNEDYLIELVFVDGVWLVDSGK